jgi:hypothetical protein
MTAETNIALTVVVSGAPQGLKINAHQKVAELMRKALHQAKIPGGDLAGWSLRFAEGGEAISPEARVAEAGVSAGATLFLDRDEGGGGEAVASAPVEQEEPAQPLLVDPEISARKLAREMEHWEENRPVYEQRGWLLLGHGDLFVDVAFTARLPIGPVPDLVAIPLAVRFGFDNYDVWAPSVRVIDPITRRWLEVPRVAALDFSNPDPAGLPLNLFVLGHPKTGRVFLCRRGVREYHNHPEHSGDDWLLYRAQGYGTLAALCDLLWRRAVRTVTGLNFIAQRISIGDGGALNQAVEIRQENAEELEVQARGQMPQVIGQVPLEIQEQLPPQIQAELQGFFNQADNG